MADRQLKLRRTRDDRNSCENGRNCGEAPRPTTCGFYQLICAPRPCAQNARGIGLYQAIEDHPKCHERADQKEGRAIARVPTC